MAMVAFGKRLCELRESYGLLSSDVARLLACQPRTVRQWEQGRGRPHLDSLTALAEHFAVSVDWLLGRAGAHRDAPALQRAKENLRAYLRASRRDEGPVTPAQRVATVLAHLCRDAPELFTPEHLCRHLLIDAAMLQGLLQGQSMVTAPLVQRVAALTELPAAWLLGQPWPAQPGAEMEQSA